MKKIVSQSFNFLVAFLIIFGFNYANAQLTHRDLLPEFSTPELTQAIIPQENFKPFHILIY